MINNERQNKKLTGPYFARIFLLFIACSDSSKRIESSIIKNNGWTAVFKHDENGKPIDGSIDSLIAGIRNGYDVRVGWGWEKELGDSILRLKHIAEPLFLTIIQENNVSVIIDTYPLLASYFDIKYQKIVDGGHLWQCVLTTKGEFNVTIGEWEKIPCL